jgi:hypothetical protein
MPCISLNLCTKPNITDYWRSVTEIATRTGAYYVRKNDQTWETLKPLVDDLMAFETSDTIFKNTA